MTTRPKIPPLPLPGVNPWLTVEDDARRAYAAFYGGKPLIDNYLQRHPREHRKEFELRKQISYGLARTQRAVHWLTRTVDNAQYPVERDFGNAYPDLAKLAAHSAPSGKTWDSRLNQLLENALLGGVSYQFLDQTSAPPTLNGAADIDKIRNNVEALILRAHQVWDIVLTPDGYIKQCSILTDLDPTGAPLRLIQYTEIEIRTYIRKDGNSDWVLIEALPNIIGIAPLIPLVVTGDLNEPESIRTNVQAVARLDVDMMNQLSDARQAFGMFNYPMLAMPEGESSSNTRNGLLSKVEKDDDDIILSAARGLHYNEKNGRPFFVESLHLYLDKTIELITYLSQNIDDMIGVNLAPDHPLASGIAKQFDSMDQSEVFRANHAKLQAAEYQAWYLIAKMIAPNRSDDFQTFKENVTIMHPVHFDPTGGYVRQRLDAIIKSPMYATATPDIKLTIEKQYWRSNLEDLVPQDQLMTLIDGITIEPILEQQQINDQIRENIANGGSNTGSRADTNAKFTTN